MRHRLGPGDGWGERAFEPNRVVGKKGRDRIPMINGRARRGWMVRCRMGDWVELLPRHKKLDAKGGAFLLRGPWKCGSGIRLGPRVGGTLGDVPLLAALLMEKPPL